MSDREYFKHAREFHEFVISDYIFSRAANLPTIMAAYPVSAIHGGEEAVVIAAIDLKWMSQLMSKRGDRAGVSVLLVDSKGVILASRPENTSLIGHPLKDTSLLEAVTLREINQGRETGSISFESANGDKQAISFAGVKGTKARLIVSINEAKMLGDIDRDIWTAYLQLALVGILALLGAWIAGERLIIRPIKVLTGHDQPSSARAICPLAPRKRRCRVNSSRSPTHSTSMASQLSEREREMMAANDRLTVIASIDMVSGLANRRGFQSRLEFEWMKAIQTDTTLSLMMIDVDYFKLFNDTYGHLEGDTCLGRVGEALAAIARRKCRVRGTLWRGGILPAVAGQRRPTGYACG